MNFAQDQLGPLLHDAARLVRKRFAQRASEYGLSSAQWRLLAVVLREGRASQARIADKLEIEPISVSRLVDRMEQAGWVAREPDPDDRRVRVIVPTASTLLIKNDLKAMADSVFAEALSALAPEARATLIAGLATVTATLSQAVCDAAADVKDT